jgi:hypothetical protein
MTKADLADMLDRFIGDAPGCGDHEWDDFTSTSAETELEPFRQRLLTEIDPLIGCHDQREQVRSRVAGIISELRADA